MLLYDVFDEDVLTLGYGAFREGIAYCRYSNESFETEEESLEFPQELLEFFAGNEEAAIEVWEEDVCFESEKLSTLFSYMTKDKIPEQMIGKWEIKEIFKDFKKLIV